jgi:serine/threonine protein kinase
LDETAEPEGEDPLVGQTLDDRYEIQKSLDRGGMGTVYLAWDRGLERQVVVKIPHARLMADRTFRLRFLQEIRDLANHEHPAILRIEASGSHGDVPYAVVQYLRGGNLRERITEQGGRQTVEEIREWLPTIADALDTVHKNGSLHRDVKPANILFDASGNAILSDFGIATAIGAADPDAPTQEVRSELTVVGTFVGSPAYAPPEAIDRILTPAYDQYSLATVVYFALVGELPFNGQTNEAILIAKERNTPPKIDRKKLKGPLSASAEKALMKALSRRPEDRFGSCTEFANAFVNGSKASSGSSRRALAAGAIAAGLAALLFFATRIDWDTEVSPSDANPPGVEDETSDASDTLVTSDASIFPVTVELGSTPQEIDRAISLCRQGGGDAQDCARDQFADERLRTVTLTAFEIDRTEVTNADFARFVQATGYRTTAEKQGYGWDITRCRKCSWKMPRANRLATDHPNDPVVQVSWSDARAYCEWADSRLPTEDEWEYSARGRDRRTFPWGDDWDAGRIRDVRVKGLGLEPVGSHPTGATPEGIQDLAGSVWEWTSTTVGSGENRIFKGGSWSESIPAYFRSATFADESPDYVDISLGFRCARDVK